MKSPIIKRILIWNIVLHECRPKLKNKKTKSKFKNDVDKKGAKYFKINLWEIM